MNLTTVERERLYQSLIKNIVDNRSLGEEFDLTGINLTPEIIMKALEDLGYMMQTLEILNVGLITEIRQEHMTSLL